MRRAITRPAIYLAAVASLFLVLWINPEIVLARGAVMILTAPWNFVMFYLVGVFGTELSALMGERQAAVLGIAGALTQAAVLAWFGARKDAKAGVPRAGPNEKLWFAIALVVVLSPGVLLWAVNTAAQLREDRRFAAQSNRLLVSQQQRERTAVEALGVLLRAEYAWAAAHPGGLYTARLADLAPGANTDAGGALVRLKMVRYRVTLARREGWWFHPVTSFRFDVGPEEKAPYAHGYYADESGFIHYARMRELPSAASPLSGYPSQGTYLAGVTPDGSAVAVVIGVRVRYLDAATGGVRNSVNTPGDFLQVSLDSAGKPVGRRSTEGRAEWVVNAFDAPADSARTFSPPPEAGALARTVQGAVSYASGAGWFAEYGFVIDSSRGAAVGEPHPAFALYDAETGARRMFVRVPATHAPHMFSPDRRFVLTRVITVIPHPPIRWTPPAPSGSPDDIGTINIWDIATGKMVFSLGTKLQPWAFGVGGLILNQRDTTLEVLDGTTGAVVSTLAAGAATSGSGGGAVREGYTAAFNRDARFVATKSARGIVRLWEVAGGRLIREWDISKLP